MTIHTLVSSTTLGGDLVSLTAQGVSASNMSLSIKKKRRQLNNEYKMRYYRAEADHLRPPLSLYSIILVNNQHEACAPVDVLSLYSGFGFLSQGQVPPSPLP